MIAWLTRFAACAAALFGAALAAAQPPFAPAPETERVVYRHATLIDGTGTAARRDMAVVTRGERIEAVLADAALTPAQTDGARVVDLSRRFLLPGLIDSHQHLATPPNRRQAEALMRRDIYSGITATRIMADDLRSIAELDRAARVGEIAGPDLYFAAVAAGPSFFADPRTRAISGGGWTPGETPWAQAIDDRTDLPLAIARARGTGATALKIYANLSPRLVRRLTAEAHRQGLAVWAHGMVFPTPPADVIAAGPDVISHTCYLAYQAVERRPARYQDRAPIDPAPFASGDNPVMARLFAEMRRRNIILDPTLRVYREVERRSAGGGRPPYCTLDLAARLTDQARRAGVLLSAGTDGDTPREAAYPALFEELELLVSRAGMTPLEAIRAATRIGAMTMGQNRQMGVIAPGYRANLVVLERDPVADIANMRSVLFAVRRGRRFERADYRPISREEMPDDD
ncbi:amidohydrolase family protein [Sphingosinicella sp.]|uniref:amidohydrolase family protein n=1 Tax=Sphingosinicella sp. TaxID=1917971 RepID=UPI004037F55C